MDETPHNPELALGDGTPNSLVDLEAAGVISVSGADDLDDDAFALEMADELEAYDAELIATEGLDAMTSDRAARLVEFTRMQTAEREAAMRAAEGDPSRVGSLLAAFRRRRGLTHDQLTDWLGMDVHELGRLSLLPLPPIQNELSVLLDPEPVNDLADQYSIHRERMYEAIDQDDP